MIKFIKRMLVDISNGQNIELYITLLISSMAIGLSIAGVTSDNQLYEAILGVLILITIGLLINRRSFENLENIVKEKVTPIDIRRKSFLVADVERMKNAKSINWVGFTLHKAIGLFQSELRSCLKNRGKIRIILIDPESDIPQQLAEIGVENGDKDEIIRNIYSTIKSIKSINAKEKYKIQVKFSPILIPYRLLMTNENSKKGVMDLAQFMHPQSEERVIMTINSENEEWYNFYKDQFEKFWNSAKEIKDTANKA